MAENKREDLTVYELQRRKVKEVLSEELAGKHVLRDEVLAMIEEDERKIAELERIVNEGRPYESVGEITVSVNANVDDAVAGFKRLQRELRETTKAVRELESAYKDAEKASKNIETWY